jgi:hypothetical protein
MRIHPILIYVRFQVQISRIRKKFSQSELGEDFRGWAGQVEEIGKGELPL